MICSIRWRLAYDSSYTVGREVYFAGRIDRHFDGRFQALAVRGPTPVTGPGEPDVTES
jgi:hypothetical protein